MNDEGALQGAPDAEPRNRHPRYRDDPMGTGRERAAFDIRVHVEGRSRREVYLLVNELVYAARQVAPAGVDVRYSQLRDGRRSRSFNPSFWPRKGHHK